MSDIGPQTEADRLAASIKSLNHQLQTQVQMMHMKIIADLASTTQSEDLQSLATIDTNADRTMAKRDVILRELETLTNADMELSRTIATALTLKRNIADRMVLQNQDLTLLRVSPRTRTLTTPNMVPAALSKQPFTDITAPASPITPLSMQYATPTPATIESCGSSPVRDDEAVLASPLQASDGLELEMSGDEVRPAHDTSEDASDKEHEHSEVEHVDKIDIEDVAAPVFDDVSSSNAEHGDASGVENVELATSNEIRGLKLEPANDSSIENVEVAASDSKLADIDVEPAEASGTEEVGGSTTENFNSSNIEQPDESGTDRTDACDDQQMESIDDVQHSSRSERTNDAAIEPPTPELDRHSTSEVEYDAMASTVSTLPIAEHVGSEAQQSSGDKIERVFVAAALPAFVFEDRIFSVLEREAISALGSSTVAPTSPALSATEGAALEIQDIEESNIKHSSNTILPPTENQHIGSFTTKRIFVAAALPSFVYVEQTTNEVQPEVSSVIDDTNTKKEDNDAETVETVPEELAQAEAVVVASDVVNLAGLSGSAHEAVQSDTASVEKEVANSTTSESVIEAPQLDFASFASAPDTPSGSTDEVFVFKSAVASETVTTSATEVQYAFPESSGPVDTTTNTNSGEEKLRTDRERMGYLTPAVKALVDSVLGDAIPPPDPTEESAVAGASKSPKAKTIKDTPMMTAGERRIIRMGRNRKGRRAVKNKEITEVASVIDHAKQDVQKNTPKKNDSDNDSKPDPETLRLMAIADAHAKELIKEEADEKAKEAREEANEAEKQAAKAAKKKAKKAKQAAKMAIEAQVTKAIKQAAKKAYQRYD